MEATMQARRGLWVIVSVFLTGCGGSSGFQQAALRDAAQSAAPQVNDGEVARAFALRPQLPRPYRLGVVFRDPVAPTPPADWRWEPEHRARLLQNVEALEGRGQVAAAFAIARSTLIGEDLRAIRIAAARHGADAVLVVSGRDEIEQGWNGWAASYVALLPILFAPAVDFEVRFSAHAELWDVRNEYLYMAAEGEARVAQSAALPFVDREQVDARAQRQALELLGKELEKRLQRLHARG
jgi:hypothetical protein